MCEPLLPIDELRDIKWAVQCLSELGSSPGSHEAENKRNAARGITVRIDWVISMLELAGEGRKNFNSG